MFTRLHAVNKETVIFHYSEKYTWVLSSIFSIGFWISSADKSREFIYSILLVESVIAVLVTGLATAFFLRRVSSIKFFKTLNVEPPFNLVKQLLIFSGLLCVVVLYFVFELPDTDTPGTALRLAYVFFSPLFYGLLVAICLSRIITNSLSLFFTIFQPKI